MEEKFYSVGTHTSANFTTMRSELTRIGTSRSSVPSREVRITDEIIHSSTRGEFLLTDEEAALLRNDSQISYVMLSIDKYPELYPATEDDVSLFPTNNTPQNRYSDPTKHYQRLFANSSDKTPDEGRTNYGIIEGDLNHATSHLIRLTQKQSQWVASNKADPTATDIDELNITAHHQQKGAGEGVDVIVADDGCWFGHVEFINSGVTNAVNPTDYIGGNAFSSTGYCDLLDVVLDGPYYLDPDWFNADPTNRLMTRWDGTTVPVESVARSWWSDKSQRSSQFVNVGEVTIHSDYTRNNVHGSPTIIPYTYVVGGSTRYKGNGTHGTPCGALTYGRTQGWAYNANKWHISLYGRISTGGENNIMLGIERGADIVKIFHQNKPINPDFETKNPTVMSNSWGLRFSLAGQGSYYFFQNSSATFYNVSNAPTFLDRGGVLTGNTAEQHAPELQPSSVLTAWGELATSGVIVVAAAGNEKHVETIPGNPNFDNRVAKNPADGIYTSGQFSGYGLDFTGTTNRRGFPQQAGVNQNGDFSLINIQVFENTPNVQYPVIAIGCMGAAFRDDDDFQKEQIASYSNRGDGIDIYAPGDGTLAATRYRDASETYGGRGFPRFDNIYPGLSALSSNLTGYPVYPYTSLYYTIEECQDAYFNGTSAACPVAAGWLSTIIQYNRGWTYQDVRNYINNTIQPQSTDDFYTGSGEQNTTDPNSDTWTDSRNIQGSSPKIAYVEDYSVTTPFGIFIDVEDDTTEDDTTEDDTTEDDTTDDTDSITDTADPTVVTPTTQIHLISSSLFIQVGSPAEFKNGISASVGLSSSGTITANEFIGIGDNKPILNVGSASSENIYSDWETTVGTTIRISASGDFDTFMFLKNNTLTQVGDSSVWETVSIGSGNGLNKKSFINQTFNEPGVYEYFILASNNTTLKTVFKGTTVTVT